MAGENSALFVEKIKDMGIRIISMQRRISKKISQALIMWGMLN